MNVSLFVPCFIDQLYPETAMNTIKVLEKAGCKVFYNPEQTCCGQPAFNSGFWDEAKTVGQKFIDTFPDDMHIVSPSGSCVGMVKTYYNDLFTNAVSHNKCRSIQNNIYELSDFLVNVVGVTDLGASLSAKATYHDACGALRECGIKQSPRILLENVKGLELLEMNDVETCCGFGGTFAVKFESISAAMGQQKVNNSLDTGAEIVISTDASCLLLLQGYIDKQRLPIKTMHLADVLVSGW